MNKTEFISFLATENNITKTEAEKIVNTFTGGVTKALADGQEVAIMGFGAFRVKTVAAHTGFDPRKNQKIELPERKQASFKVGEALRKAVNA